MANFLEYSPEQAHFLPPSVRDVLGGTILFLCPRRGGETGWQPFEAGYSDAGHPAYHPALLLKVWRYA
jgi:hypothetical protein